METPRVGSIVRCRDREWIVLPTPQRDIAFLRPLTGGEREVCGIYLPLARLGIDAIAPAKFPAPTPQDTSDALGAELLWDAARLTLRDGAGPFRSLGRISVRPRAYQFVPLLMALRLDPIRMLIADDVGIGKTIEAILIAREILDRADVQRLCVLCPPYLCDQWQKELRGKFQIDAVVIRSGTVSQLERNLPSGDRSIFGHYPHIVVSIDYAKSDSHKANFLQHCPDFVIVDEAHGAARPAGQSRGQQQRHQLLCQLAAKPERHVLLLSATPHSGVEESFLSLLGLLKTDFGSLDLQNLREPDRDELARHFVQRRRADIQRWLGEDNPFPARNPEEATYQLSAKCRDLFRRVYTFSAEMVQSAEALSGSRRRIRYWSALALLRCVMSSPAAAQAALLNRVRGEAEDIPDEQAADDACAPYIYEPADQETEDAQPAHVVEQGEADMSGSERRQLRHFATLAAEVQGTDDDHKIVECSKLVAGLLRDGYHPIIWCRYIATSDYVAEQLAGRLQREFRDLRVISITGALADEERRLKVAELGQHPRRVLVATDCLSEGINLQEHFTAVVHYDLPWNPNRLEQREGRVDRFGQNATNVKAILFYGRDNIVDGAVLDVLLRKAKEIHRTLGISVPIPMDSQSVMEAVLKHLFFRSTSPDQKLLFDDPIIEDMHRQWDRSAVREKESRTRFAQRAIKPDEVKRELEETDSVLGDPGAVERFVLNACQRLGATVQQAKLGQWTLSGLGHLPDLVKESASDAPENWRVTFKSPPPEGATYLGRNHPFVAALAQFLMEEALTQGGAARATRCGVIKSRAVDRRTVLLLLRLRFLIEEPDKGDKPMLAEEVYVCAYRGSPPDRLDWLPDGEPLRLLTDACPDANTSPQERSEVLSEALGAWDGLQKPLEPLIVARAKRLDEAHRRVRASARLVRRGLRIVPQLPPDLLGVLVLQPIPRGVAR